jgi:hypothetical protein
MKSHVDLPLEALKRKENNTMLFWISTGAITYKIHCCMGLMNGDVKAFGFRSFLSHPLSALIVGQSIS